MSLIFQSNPSQMFYRVDVLKNCVKSTGNHLQRSLFLIELQCSFWQIDFPVNFGKFLKTLFIEHLWVAASALCKNFVILQVLANFNKSSFIFPLLSLLLCNPFFCDPCVFSTSNFLKQTFNLRVFPKNTTDIEAVIQTCSSKKVFLKFSQNSQENTCAGVSF